MGMGFLASAHMDGSGNGPGPTRKARRGSAGRAFRCPRHRVIASRPGEERCLLYSSPLYSLTFTT